MLKLKAGLLVGNVGVMTFGDSVGLLEIGSVGKGVLGARLTGADVKGDEVGAAEVTLIIGDAEGTSDSLKVGCGWIETKK